jgi:hypothetical protein
MAAELAPHSLAAVAPDLFDAVARFITHSTNFESAAITQAAIDDAGATTTPEDLFAVPIQHKLFSMDTALRWLLFLSVASQHEAGGPFFAGAPHDTRAAMQLIVAVYDIGVKDAALDYLEPEDSDSDDDSDDEPEVDTVPDAHEVYEVKAAE